MRLLSALLLAPLFAVVFLSIAIGTVPYHMRHSLRCSLPQAAAELLLSGLHTFERAAPFPQDALHANIYEFMCLPPTASLDELKHAFRHFALRHHPDHAPRDAGAMFTSVRAALDSLISDRAGYDASFLSSVSQREAVLGPKCLAVGSSAALLALLLHVFLQLHYARTTVAQNQQAYEAVAAKKRAERARMMEERQRQVVVREQRAADAAEAAAAHEAAVRREYTALREELRIAEVVPDRHMTLASMEQRIDDMKQERVKRQELRLQQQAAHALRIQQQQQAAAAAAELEAQKPKPATRQVPAVPEHRPFDREQMQCGGRTVRDSAPEAAARASPHDRLADRLAAARRMQEQQLHAVAAANAASIPAAEESKAAATESDSAAAAAARGDNTADMCVSVKVLTKPQPTDYGLQLPQSASIADVCQQLHEQHGLRPWPGMKVVYCGSVLSHAQTLQSIGFSSGKSLVVTAPPESSSRSAAAPSSAACINAAIDAAYDESLAADSLRQPH